MKLTWAMVLLVLAAMLLVNLGAAEAERQRSGKWPAARDAHLKAESYCALCGTLDELEVHHLKPFHIAPELELAETNLITLCRHCHFEAGHLGNWTNEVSDLRALVGETGARFYRLRLGRSPAADRN